MLYICFQHLGSAQREFSHQEAVNSDMSLLVGDHEQCYIT